jgi:hypothetical protein
MHIAARPARQTTLVVLLVALTTSVALGMVACRDPHAADGAGGQSGDEGRRPQSLADGAGGGSAELP